jgi:hypothetical protein
MRRDVSAPGPSLYQRAGDPPQRTVEAARRDRPSSKRLALIVRHNPRCRLPRHVRGFFSWAKPLADPANSCQRGGGGAGGTNRTVQDGSHGRAFYCLMRLYQFRNGASSACPRRTSPSAWTSGTTEATASSSTLRYSRQVVSAHFSGPEIPFPGNGDRERQRLGSNAGYAEGSPSMWCWRDHSAGRSARRTTPDLRV